MKDLKDFTTVKVASSSNVCLYNYYRSFGYSVRCVMS
jgi:hypothetical protein